MGKCRKEESEMFQAISDRPKLMSDNKTPHRCLNINCDTVIAGDQTNVLCSQCLLLSPKPPTVTISRESLDKLIADWRQMAAFVKSDGHGVSSAYDNCADQLATAMEVKGE